MNKSAEIVEIYYNTFGGDYKRKSIRTALEIIDACAIHYKENYMPNDLHTEDFTPHDWAVASICEALESKKFWKSFGKD